MKAKTLAAFLILIMAATGCISEYESDSDEGKGAITNGTGLDKKKNYHVISSYLEKMTSEVWNIKGTAYELRRDTALGNCTGQFTRQTGDQTEFEGRIVIPVREMLSISFDKDIEHPENREEGNDTVITKETVFFYSEEGILLAEVDVPSNQIISRLSSDELDSGGWPEEGRTGDFDFLYEMTLTSGHKRSSVWYLESADEGNADFVIRSADRKDESAEAEIVEEKTITINIAGDIIKKKLKIFDLEKRYRIELDMTRM